MKLTLANKTGLIIVFFLSAWAGAEGPPHGECWRYWLTRAFQSGPGENSYLFQTGGAETYDAFYRRLERDRCWKEWTLVIYMAADNDLSPYAFRDLWEMEAEGSAPSTDVLVFLDDAQTQKTRYLHIAKRSEAFDWVSEVAAFVKAKGLEEDSLQEQEESFLREAGPAALEGEGGLIQSPVVLELPEADSGKLRTAADFLKWVAEHYPSRRMALLGWSHGEGFDAPIGANPDVQPALSGKPGGFAFDFSSRSHMMATEMARGLKLFLRRYRGGKALDLLGSDACLNQQLEFGWEWEGLSEYVFGSSSLVQHKGFNYRSLLELFNEGPRKQNAYFAKRIPEIYGASVSSGSGHAYGSYYDPDATMTSLRMEALPRLVQSLDHLGAELGQWLQAEGDPLESLTRKMKLRTQIAQRTRLGGVSHDLFELLVELKQHPQMEVFTPARVEVENALKDALAGLYLGKNVRHQSLGVGLWLPLDVADAKRRLKSFQKSRLYIEAPRWAAFVQNLYRDDIAAR